MVFAGRAGRTPAQPSGIHRSAARVDRTPEGRRQLDTCGAATAHACSKPWTGTHLAQIANVSVIAARWPAVAAFSSKPAPPRSVAAANEAGSCCLSWASLVNLGSGLCSRSVPAASPLALGLRTRRAFGRTRRRDRPRRRAPVRRSAGRGQVALASRAGQHGEVPRQDRTETTVGFALNCVRSALHDPCGAARRGAAMRGRRFLLGSFTSPVQRTKTSWQSSSPHTSSTAPR